jgi:glucokinase
MILAGDIGGTKTDLAIFTPEAGPRKPLVRKEFPSGQYPSLEAILREFVDGVDGPIERACFAVAGPVIGGQANITNLTWVVDLESLKRELGLEDVVLMNDLQAIALAVPILQPDELATLNEGEAAPGGAIGVIAPGTGMGEAFLMWTGTRYQAYPSEGGHADFAPGDELEIGLLQYMLERFSHVSIERVCSGRGLPNIYDYLRDTGHAPEPPEVAAELATAQDRTAVIVEHALHPTNPCELCEATLDTFIAIFGAEAGNLALKILSTGGVYLAGGIPPRILSMLQNGRFVQAFLRKGRLSELLSHMPIRVVLSRAALLGIANYGLELSRESATRKI